MHALIGLFLTAICVALVVVVLRRTGRREEIRRSTDMRTRVHNIATGAAQTKDDNEALNRLT